MPKRNTDRILKDKEITVVNIYREEGMTLQSIMEELLKSVVTNN